LRLTSTVLGCSFLDHYAGLWCFFSAGVAAEVTFKRGFERGKSGVLLDFERGILSVH